jgi:ABC-type nitrate/sulfonate/bicarbonate transport system permease component
MSKIEASSMKPFAGINLPGLVSFLALLFLWEISSRSSHLIQSYFPPVSEIVRSLLHLIFSREVIGHVLATLGRFLTGYLLSAVIAVSLGVLLGHLRFVYAFFEVLIEFLRPMPSVAMIPVAILLLGIGNPMIVAVTIYACTWPILINTIDGVRNIEPTLIDTGRTFGLGRWKILKGIVLPAAMPYIVTGLRISLAIALILVTTSEMVVGGSGLGFFILDEERSLSTTNMYAGIVIVAVLGYGLNRLFLFFEGKAMAWHRGATARGLL